MTKTHCPREAVGGAGADRQRAIDEFKAITKYL